MIHNNSWNDYIKDFLLWLDFTNNIYFTKCKKCYKKAFMFFIFSIRKTCPDLWAILVPYFSSCLKRCEQMTMTLFLLHKTSSIYLYFKYSTNQDPFHLKSISYKKGAKKPWLHEKLQILTHEKCKQNNTNYAAISM